jgi:hypothetical protein
MRIPKVILPLLLTVVAAMIPETSFAAASSKSVNVCSLSTASVATAITGISSKCVKAATSPGPGSTAYSATWAGKSKTEDLTVTIDAYASNSFLSVAKKNLPQGFSGGKPSKINGVGSGAYPDSAAGIAAIHFSVGSDIVYISLTTTGSTPTVSPSLIAFAKSVASKITTPAKTTTVKTTPVKTTTTVSGSLSGSWSGTYSGAFSGTFSLSWQQSGSQLSGTIKVSSLGNSPTNVTGTVQGTKITFGTVGSNAIQYSGSFSGSTMSGSWTLGSADGSWSANKS